MKRQNKKPQKIIAIILVQSFLISNLAWAGTSSVFLAKNKNIATLSPQTIISTTAFQQACATYAFWSKRVPGIDALSQKYTNAKMTQEALNAIPKQYCTDFYLNRSFVKGGNPILYEACNRFSIKVPKLKYTDVHVVYTKLKTILEKDRTAKALKRKVKDGGDSNLLKYIYKYKKELKDIYGFELQTDIQHAKYDTPKAVFDALMEVPEKKRTRKLLGRSKEDKGNVTLLRWYVKFEAEILKKYDYYIPKEHTSRPAVEYNSAKDVYDALMALKPKQRTMDYLDRSVKEGGDRRLLTAYRKYKKEIKQKYKIEIKRREIDKLYGTWQATYQALMQIPEQRRTTWHLNQPKLEKGNRTLLKAARAFKKQLKEKKGFELPVQENPLLNQSLKYPDPKSVYEAIIARDESDQTVKSLDRIIDEDGDRKLLERYYVFEEQIKELFNYELKRDKGKYAETKDIYNAIMARQPEQRTRQALDKDKKYFGDRCLLKRILAKEKELLEEFGFVLEKEKYQRPLKYPTPESVYQALMARDSQLRTVVALKTSKANKGNRVLLKAYYEHKFEIARKFHFTLPKANAASYPDFKITYKALMELSPELLTAKSLDRPDQEYGNRSLLKAYRKFKKELRETYGFVMPKAQRKRIAKYQTPEDVYQAIMARPENERTQTSLRRKKDDDGDPALLKEYYRHKQEIFEKYGFNLTQETEPMYPDGKSTKKALMELPEKDRTTKRLDELGLYSLRKACNNFEIPLPKEEKALDYPDRESAIAVLKEIPLRDRTAARLRRKTEDGGNPTLLNNCYKYAIRLPKEEVMQAYPKKQKVLDDLAKLSEQDKLPSRLSRQPSKGGNPLLFLAILEHEIELPKDQRKYPNKRLAEMMLSRLPKRMRTARMLHPTRNPYGEGDYTLYMRCLEFKIPLEREPSEFIYPTVEATYKALKAIPKEKRTRTHLMLPKDTGGDPTLYNAFKRFRKELKQKYNFKIEREHAWKYKTKEQALAAFNALASEDRTAGKLLRTKKNKGNFALYYACIRFEISFAEPVSVKKYPDTESAREGLMARPLEKRYASELTKLKGEGGDPSLYDACLEFKIPLPIKEKQELIYSDEKITFVALMEIPEEERFVSKLSRPKPKGNPTLLAAYYKFRSILKAVYGFAMKAIIRSPYPTLEAAQAALEKRPESERTVTALDQAYPKGNRALLRAARKFKIELPKGNAKQYPDAESVYTALKNRKEKLNTSKMLNRPRGQGGNRTLLLDYYEHRDQIKEEFNYVLPQEERKGMNAKYKTPEEAQAVLNERSEGERTAKSLRQKKDEGGDWALYAACKRFGIKLDDPKPMQAGYDRYKEEVLKSMDSVNIDVFDYWQRMQEVNAKERDSRRSVLIEYFMPMIFNKAENGKKAKEINFYRNISYNQAYHYDDLINSAVIAVMEAIEFWHPDLSLEEDNTVEAQARADINEYIEAKINQAMGLEKKVIYQNKWTHSSIETPSGNKGGNNVNSKPGKFGGSNHKTLGDTLKSEAESVDNTISRFEKMQEVLENFKKADYSFIQSAINTLDSETAANFDLDESLLLSKAEKLNFQKDLLAYCNKKDILKHIPGKFSIWLMGSLGNIGLARKGLSDVNILIVTDAPENSLRQTIVDIRTAIGSGLIKVGKDGNVTLEIGRDDDYRDMVFNAQDFLTLTERYDLGNQEKGIASIEIVSVNTADAGSNRAIHRAQFHLTEDLYQMGENAALIAESQPGVAQQTKDEFKQNIAMGNHDYLFFMNDYLMGFFMKQVRKVIAAHKFAHPGKGKTKTVKPEAVIKIEPGSIIKFPKPKISWISPNQVKLGETIVNVIRNNGSLSIQLTGVLTEGVDSYQEFWQQVAKDFDGKEIFVDDPEVDTNNINPAMLVAIEEQTDQICDILANQAEALYAGEAVLRRIDHDPDFSDIKVLEFQENDKMMAMLASTLKDKSLKKNNFNLQAEPKLIEQAI